MAKFSSDMERWRRDQEIRYRHKECGESLKSVAARYGITEYTVWKKCVPFYGKPKPSRTFKISWNGQTKTLLREY
jgi:hypothetical protein